MSIKNIALGLAAWFLCTGLVDANSANGLFPFPQNPPDKISKMKYWKLFVEFTEDLFSSNKSFFFQHQPQHLKQTENITTPQLSPTIKRCSSQV